MTLVYDESQEEMATLTERRRGLRITQQRPVKVFDAAANRYVGGRTADISSNGLRLELPAWAPVAPGKMLHVHVGIGASGSPLANRRNMMPARVIWVAPRLADSRATVSIGIEFLASVAAHLDAA